MFKAMWKNWKSAGYWSEVVVEYSKLTGLNLEQDGEGNQNTFSTTSVRRQTIWGSLRKVVPRSFLIMGFMM